MNKKLMDRLRTLEFRMRRKRVPQGMAQAYENMVRLGLGEEEPEADTPTGLGFLRGIAWLYRRMMIDLDSGKREPKDDWERSILVRYRERLVAGLIRDFEFSDEDGLW
jgi:hypothetical protein